MAEVNENSELYTHYQLGTLPGRPHLFPTVHTMKQQRSAPRATEEDLFLVIGDSLEILPPQMLQRSVLACQ